MARPLSVERSIERLQHGNRYGMRARLPPLAGPPLAVVVACSDQRAQLDEVFGVDSDAIVLVQEPGPFASSSVIAAAEFATATQQIGLIVLLAHEDCPLLEASLHAPAALPRCELERSAARSVRQARRATLAGSHAVAQALELRGALSAQPSVEVVAAVLRAGGGVDFIERVAAYGRDPVARVEPIGRNARSN